MKHKPGFKPESGDIILLIVGVFALVTGVAFIITASSEDIDFAFKLSFGGIGIVFSIAVFIAALTDIKYSAEDLLVNPANIWFTEWQDKLWVIYLRQVYLFNSFDAKKKISDGHIYMRSYRNVFGKIIEREGALIVGNEKSAGAKVPWPMYTDFQGGTLC